VHAQTTVTPARLPDVLLNVAIVRPVFLWAWFLVEAARDMPRLVAARS